MKTFQIQYVTLSKVFLFVSLGICSWLITGAVLTTLNQINKTQSDLVAQVEIGRSDLKHLSSYTVESILTRVDKIDRNLNTRISSIEKTIDKRFQSIEGTALSSVQQSLSRVDRVVDLAEKNLDKIGPVLDTVSLAAQNSKPYVDCKRNKGCIQETTVETLNAVRAAARDGSRLAFTLNGQVPEIVNNSIRISESVEKSSNAVSTDLPHITSNINDITKSLKERVKIHWYDRVIGWAINGLIAYGVTK